jgi:hypothetical protein
MMRKIVMSILAPRADPSRDRSSLTGIGATREAAVHSVLTRLFPRPSDLSPHPARDRFGR